MASTTFDSSIKRVNSDSTGPKGDLRRAKSLFKEKRFNEALAEVEAVLKKDASSLQSHLAAGNLKARLGRNDEALMHFQTIIRLAPSKTRAYLKAGRIYMDQKKYDQALALFEDAIRVEPKSAVLYVAAGQALLDKQAHGAAVEKLAQALRLNPRLLAARQRLALAYSKLHKYPEAIAQLKAALRISPDNAGAYAGLGRIYLLQKEFAAAREAYQQALTIKPNGRVSVRLGLAEALIEEDRLADASQLLTDLPQKDQSGARLHTLWGELYKRQGLFKESAEEYQAAARLVSEQTGLEEELGDIDFMQEQDDDYWEQIVESFSSKAQAKVTERRSSI